MYVRTIHLCSLFIHPLEPVLLSLSCRAYHFSCVPNKLIALKMPSFTHGARLIFKRLATRMALTNACVECMMPMKRPRLHKWTR